LLSEHRDIAAAKQFFIRAIKQHGVPEKITVDGYPATHTAISELKAEEILPHNTKVRTSKYLNNLIEQDHRRVKQRIYPMLGFKRFSNAAVTINGVELVQKIRKSQFNMEKLTSSVKVRAPEMWEAVLAA
jgi:transposase-like protein